MARAVWNGKVIAESSTTELVDGNHYFPPDSIQKEFYEASGTTSVCGWKGTANYYTLSVEGQKNADAAWYYAEPKSEASHIKGYVAFWKGVTVEETPAQHVNEAGGEGSCSTDGSCET